VHVTTTGGVFQPSPSLRLSECMATPTSRVVAQPSPATASSRTVFDHIPKTAGTSVRAALATALGEPLDVEEVTCPHRVAVSQAGERRCIASHMWFCPGETLAPGWYYATLLREPVERFLSQYFFYRGHRTEVWRGTMTDPLVVAAAKFDLEHYLADPALRRSYTNVQAIHFAWRMCDAPEDLDDARLLDAAVASLEDYDLVGVFADVPGFLDAYCDGLSASRQTMPRLNVTAKRARVADVPPLMIGHLQASNTVDTALYEWARQRFADRRRPRPAAGRARAIAPPANFGDRLIEILSSRCEGAASGSAVVQTEERVVVTASCRALVAADALTAGIAVRDQSGALVYATNSRLLGIPLTLPGPQTFELSFVLPLPLPVGEYRVTLALHKGLSHLEGCYHWLENAASFVVRAACPGRNDERLAPAFGHPDDPHVDRWVVSCV
jgi:Wzt-like putative exopolysaccharide export protein